MTITTAGSAGSDVVIVGAGIIGLACAHELIRAGASVRVLEQHLPGAGQSTRTGGGIRLSHGSEINVSLTRASMPFWEGFEAEFGVDPRYRRTGHLFVTSDDRHDAFLRTQADWHREAGVPTRILDNARMKSRWPHLGALGFAVGSHCSEGGYLDHHSVIFGLQQAVRENGGAIHPGTRVEGLHAAGGRIGGVATSTGDFRAGVVINAAGAEAGVIAELAGLCIPFRSRRHELLIVRPREPVPDDTPWLIDMDAQVHLRPDGQGRALIGGFLGRDDEADPRDYAREHSAGWAGRVRAAACASFGLNEPECEIVEGWAGLYPGTLDYLPVLEESKPGLITAAGFSGTGLMHAPAIGRIVRQIVRGQDPEEIDLSALRASRFDGQQGVAEATGF